MFWRGLFYDFLSMAIGKGIPYGVYDHGQNKGWAALESIMTLPLSLSKPFADGGTRWGGSSIPMPSNYLSPPMEAVVMATVSGSGRWSFRTLSMNSAFRFPFAISPRERVSGTKSNITCSPLQLKTGEESRSSVTK